VLERRGEEEVGLVDARSGGRAGDAVGLARNSRRQEAMRADELAPIAALLVATHRRGQLVDREPIGREPRGRATLRRLVVGAADLVRVALALRNDEAHVVRVLAAMRLGEVLAAVERVSRVASLGQRIRRGLALSLALRAQEVLEDVGPAAEVLGVMAPRGLGRRVLQIAHVEQDPRRREPLDVRSRLRQIRERTRRDGHRARPEIDGDRTRDEPGPDDAREADRERATRELAAGALGLLGRRRLRDER
jgi:hypothetical protein